MPEQAAHHVAEQRAGTAHAAASATMRAATTTGGAVPRGVIPGIVGGDAGGDDLGLHRLVLELVEVAGGGITARGLPAPDHRPGLLVELAGRLDVETETGEAPLHIATLALVQTDLVFGDLVGVVREGRRIDAGRQIARRRGRPLLEGGDAGERQRLEGAVRIVGEVSVELLDLVAVLDRAPELELDLAGLGDGGRRRDIRRSRCRRVEKNGAGEI